MKNLLGATLVVLLGLANAAQADDGLDKGEYARTLTQERGQPLELAAGALPARATFERHDKANRREVVEMLALATERRLGRKWVRTAIKIGWVESRFRCDARGPRLREGDRALGIGQVRLQSARALGYRASPGGLLGCTTGIAVMLDHMKRCEQSGATNEALMARCHVAGWGSMKRRLRKRAETYARQYQRMVERAPAVPKGMS